MEGVDNAQRRVPSDEVAKGEIELMTQLIGLLVTFIGEELTGHLVHEAWPEVAMEDLSD